MIASLEPRLERLPFDICDRLLTSLPTFASLRAAVLSCKTFHSVYSQRKSSILTAVVKNEVGPALAEALVVARATHDVDANSLSPPEANEIMEKMLNTEGEYWGSTIRVEDAYGLQEIARTASGFEDEFSFRYKDRSRKTSRLTCEESSRFRQAFYYHWMLSLLCHCDTEIDSDEEDDDDQIDQTVLHPADVEKLHQILSNIDDKSLCALLQITKFKRNIAERSRTSNRWLFVNEADVIAIGPTELLLAYRTHNAWHHSYFNPGSTFISRSLDNLLQKRDIPKLYQDKFKEQVIVDRVSDGYVGECHNCHRATGWLYNDTCWPSFSEIIRAGDMTAAGIKSLLPGRLPANSSVTALLDQYTAVQNSTPNIFEDIFASQNDPTETWRKEDWVCSTCSNMLVRREIVGWLIRVLIVDGHVFKPNCWYGYNCRTQTHKKEHAEKLNHLCAPDPSKEDGH